MPRKRWIKLWTQETLYGSTSKELDPAERWVWLGFLALAGDSIEPGKIQVAPNIPWTDTQLSLLLGVSISILLSAKEKMVQHGKITINGEVIAVTNWERYQSEYDRTKKYKHTLFSTPETTPKQNVENLHQKVSAIPDQRGGEGKGIPHLPSTPLLPFTKVKGFQELKNEAIKVTKKKDQIASLVEAFRFYHAHAPLSDFEKLGSRVAGIFKSISDDYLYLLKIIWVSSSMDITGSHLNYIQGMIKGGKKLDVATEYADSGYYGKLGGKSE